MLPLLFVTLSAASGQLIEAYADRTSVIRGQTIAFKMRDLHGTTIAINVPYSILRIGHDESVLSSGLVPVRYRSVPARVYEVGCGWPTNLSFTVPASWEPGLYVAHFGYGTNAESSVDFIVRAASPTANILLQIPFTTRAAYNNWGGKSLYDSGSGGVHADRVTLDRPDNGTDNRARIARELIRFMEIDGGRHGPYAMDFITSVDLHAEPSISSAYQLFIIVGHDEYWSYEMRAHLDDFVHSGGNAAIFAGNTMYYQIRFESGGGQPNRTIVCYKDHDDPFADSSRWTKQWQDVGLPSNRSIGLGYKAGALQAGQAGGGACCGVDTDTFQFKVVREASWVFDYTDLSVGDYFGGEVMGYETDALAFWRLTNIPTGLDGTPNNFQILARANLLDPAWENEGWAILGFFDYGGTVFNAGTVDWVGVPFRPLIAQITENVLTRLSTPRTALEKNTMSVHRYAAPSPFGGTKFYFSTDPFVESGWEYDGFAFHARPNDTNLTVPLYQYHAAEGGGYRFYYSTSNTVGSGWTLDGPVFHVYASPGTGRVPVYEYFVAQSGGGYRFLYSTDPTITSGWTYNGVAFYALD